MTTTNAPTFVAATPSKTAAPVQSHRLLSGVLITIGLVLTAGFAIAFGVIGLFASVFSIAVPFFLLWLSADVVRADERRG